MRRHKRAKVNKGEAKAEPEAAPGPRELSSDSRGVLSAPLLAALLLAALTVIAYLPALQAGFIWDDDAYVTKNLTLRDWAGLKRIWLEVGATPQYYPLVHSAFWLEYHAWGLNPAGYHAVNVLLHALGAILLWRCLRLLDAPLPWLTAAIFALHPVHVESVAWITERKNVLSGVCYLAAAWAYLGFALGDPRHKSPRTRWVLYALSLGLFTAAMLSKTVACTLPAALLLVIWWKREQSSGEQSSSPAASPALLNWRDVLPLLPMLAIGAPLALVTVWTEQHVVGATGSEFDLTLSQRFLLAGRILWFYPLKLILPVNLTFIYPRWQIDSLALWQYLFPAAAAGVAAALWRFRQKLGRGPLVAVLFYAGTLAPALGFINVYPFRYSFVADHFQYLASIGLIALGTGTLALLARKFAPRTQGSVVKVAGAVALLALAALTWQQCHMYRDLRTLWEETLRRNPAAWMAHNNLGVILWKEGNPQGAQRHFQEAVRLYPGYAEGHTTLASLLIEQRRFAQAQHHLQAALRADPQLAVAHYNLGVLHEAQQQPAKAAASYQTACQFNPRHLEAHYNLGCVQLKLKQLDKAHAEFQAVLRLDPEHAPAHLNLGTLSLQSGQLDGAIGHYRRAVARNPDFAQAHQNLSAALWKKGETAEAQKHKGIAERLSGQGRP